MGGGSFLATACKKGKEISWLIVYCGSPNLPVKALQNGRFSYFHWIMPLSLCCWWIHQKKLKHFIKISIYLQPNLTLFKFTSAWVTSNHRYRVNRPTNKNPFQDILKTFLLFFKSFQIFSILLSSKLTTFRHKVQTPFKWKLGKSLHLITSGIALQPGSFCCPLNALTFYTAHSCINASTNNALVDWPISCRAFKVFWWSFWLVVIDFCVFHGVFLHSLFLRFSLGLAVHITPIILTSPHHHHLTQYFGLVVGHGVPVNVLYY